MLLRLSGDMPSDEVGVRRPARALRAGLSHAEAGAQSAKQLPRFEGRQCVCGVERGRGGISMSKMEVERDRPIGTVASGEVF